MSLYQSPSLTPTTWSYRWPVTVYKSGSGSASVNFTVALPAAWDVFWNNVQSDGDDIRLCRADGTTLCTYDLSGWSASTRAGTIRVGGETIQQGKTNVFWLYWGHSTAASAAGSPATSSPESGKIALTAPSNAIDPSEQQPGVTSLTTQRIGKRIAERVPVFVLLSNLLGERASLDGGGLSYDEPASLTYVIKVGGADQASMVDADDVRLVCSSEVAGSPVYAHFIYQSNAVASPDGVLVATVETTHGYTYEPRVKLYTYDVT